MDVKQLQNYLLSFFASVGFPHVNLKQLQEEIQKEQEEKEL